MAPLSKPKFSGLTQSKLEFRAGRSFTKGSQQTKAVNDSKGLHPSLSTTNSGGSPGSSSINDIGKEETAARKFRPSTKRRRLDVDDPSEVSGIEHPSRSRTTTPGEAEEQPLLLAASRPKLDLHDRKYAQHYAKIRGQMGNLKPIHSEGLDKIHHILRIFDLTYEYGPCVGVTRLERWERAEALGLNPPPEVKDILITQEAHDDDSYKQNVFHGYEV